MIKFYCPNCKQKLGVPDEYAGRRIRCNKCGQPAIVPKPQPAAVPTPAAPAPVSAPAARPAAPSPAPAEELKLKRPPQPKQSPPPAQPKPLLDELVLAPEDDLPPVDPNLEALRQAGHDRASQMKVSPSAAKKSSGAKSKPSVATEVAKGMGKIPLSLACCFACMAGVIIAWIIVAKITGFVFGFIVMGVPVAGAWGLTRFTEHRGIMLGLLAAFLGFVGMTCGHLALAKWVVMPMLEEDTNLSETFNDAFNQGLASGTSNLSNEMVNQIAEDNDEMFYIAAMSLVSEGKMDRETVKQIMQQDTNMFDEEEEGDEEEAAEETSQEASPDLEESYSQIDSRLLSWNDAQRKQAVRQNYTELTKLRGEFLINDTGFGKAVTFLAAFIGSFGLLDLLWYPMGLFGAFKFAAALDGEE